MNHKPVTPAQGNPLTFAHPSAHPWETCKSLSRSAWTRVRALGHRSLEGAAATAGLSHSVLSRWESERADHPVPLAVLWHRELLPDDGFEELVAQARADRALQRESKETVTAEGALCGTCKSATTLLHTSVQALLDGRLSADERRELRPMLGELIAWGRRTLRILESDGIGRAA